MAEEQDTKDCLKLAMLGHGLGRNQGSKGNTTRYGFRIRPHFQALKEEGIQSY